MKNTEFENFDSTMRKLIAVPRSEITAKLEGEKAAKTRKKRKAKPSSDDREGLGNGGH